MAYCPCSGYTASEELHKIEKKNIINVINNYYAETYGVNFRFINARDPQSGPRSTQEGQS